MGVLKDFCYLESVFLVFLLVVHKYNLFLTFRISKNIYFETTHNFYVYIAHWGDIMYDNHFEIRNRYIGKPLQVSLYILKEIRNCKLLSRI